MKTSVAVTVLLVVLVGCDRPVPAEPPSSAKLSVAVSILPQGYFCRRIAGDRAAVQVLVGPGLSPATYEPTPRQMSQLSRASLYLRVGVPFERALAPKLTGVFDQLEIVHTSPDSAGQHGADGEDPHTWLDPIQAEEQARIIADALIRHDPAGRDVYEKNLAALQADLDATHSEIAEMLAPLAGREMFVFHPAYGHFARRYGLKQVAVQVEGKAPAPRRLARFIEQAKAAGTRVIFVQPQFSDRTARTIASQVGADVVELDPLAEDYLANLKAMARAISQALQGPEEKRQQS